jgi:hypothetical protein
VGHVSFSDAQREPLEHLLFDPTHTRRTEANAPWEQARFLQSIDVRG